MFLFQTVKICEKGSTIEESKMSASGGDLRVVFQRIPSAQGDEFQVLKQAKNLTLSGMKKAGTNAATADAKTSETVFPEEPPVKKPKTHFEMAKLLSKAQELKRSAEEKQLQTDFSGEPPVKKFKTVRLAEMAKVLREKRSVHCQDAQMSSSNAK